MTSVRYIYIHSEVSLWTVGFYDPKGKWQPESDHDTPAKAAARVMRLNGGVGVTDLVSELLDALRLIGEQARLEQQDPGSCDQSLAEYADRVTRDAIAKAEG